MKKSEVLIVLGVLLCDLTTKLFVASNMELHQSISVIPGFFYITYIHNTGAAWGMFEGAMPLFYLMTVVGIAFLGYLLYKSDKKEKLQRVALTLMIGGTLGNFYDRLVYHYVRDFFDFYIFGYDFPVFNIADSALVIGVFLLLISVLLEERKAKTT